MSNQTNNNGIQPAQLWPQTRSLAMIVAAVVMPAVTVHAQLKISTATRARPVEMTRSKITGHASFLTGPDGGPIPVKAPAGRAAPTPLDFLQQHGRAFGIAAPDKQLVQSGIQRDRATGQIHTTYHQVHEGVPVFSGVIKVHQDADGSFVAANGDFYAVSGKLNMRPQLQPDRAEAIALGTIKQGSPIVSKTELTIVDPGWYGDPPIGPHLAYYVEVLDASVPVRVASFIDAHTGDILDQWSLLHTAKDRGVHDYSDNSSNCCFPHSGPGCDDATCESFICSLDDVCCHFLGDWDSICAAEAARYCGTLCLPGPPARLEGEPVTGDDEVDAVYDYLGDAYGYFLGAFGLDSVDDAGATMTATIRASGAIQCPNAAYLSDLGQMVVCSGAVNDDIVAHEITHGLIDATAGLIYQNQSGQLNESYADIFGELVDLFNGNSAYPGPPSGPPWPEHPTGPGLDQPNLMRRTNASNNMCSHASSGYPDGVRWLIGEDNSAFVSSFGDAVRDMWAPACQGNPDRANSILQTCNFDDAGGVHSGSSIPNHAFAMLTDGKTFNGQTVSGIGPIKAAAVWYRALSVYLVPASDFSDFFTAVNRAAFDLIDTVPLDPRTGTPSDSAFTPFDALQVNKALLATEMNFQNICGAGVFDLNEPLKCSNRVTMYANDFEFQNPDLPGNPPDLADWYVGNDAPPTLYDWGWVRGDLPGGRTTTALFVEDPNIGDCSTPGGPADESALHYLISPEFVLPSDIVEPTLSFLHYIDVETGWDGGLVAFTTDFNPEGNFSILAFGPASITHNVYNAELFSADDIPPNTNPIAGLAAWTGLSGTWATTLVDLSVEIPTETPFRIIFVFGKDLCTGTGSGWFVDNFEVYGCDEQCLTFPPSLTGSNPPPDSIDARQPSTPAGAPPGNVQNMDLIFNRSLGCVAVEDFEVSQKLDGQPLEPGPPIVGIGPGRSAAALNVTFESPLTPGAWTRITHKRSGQSVCVASLPGDVDQNGTVSPADIGALIDCINGVGEPCPPRVCDIDRVQPCSAADIGRLVDLLNGAGVYRSWQLAELPPSPCEP